MQMEHLQRLVHLAQLVLQVNSHRHSLQQVLGQNHQELILLKFLWLRVEEQVLILETLLTMVDLLAVVEQVVIYITHLLLLTEMSR
jgi:hypothetical protein